MEDISIEAPVRRSSWTIDLSPFSHPIPEGFRLEVLEFLIEEFLDIHGMEGVEVVHFLPEFPVPGYLDGSSLEREGPLDLPGFTNMNIHSVLTDLLTNLDVHGSSSFRCPQPGPA